MDQRNGMETQARPARIVSSDSQMAACPVLKAYCYAKRLMNMMAMAFLGRRA